MISFSNEIGNLCAAVGDIDAVEVMKGVHLDKRLTPILESGERIIPSFTTYIEAGCGFGGSCFPKDVKALTAYGAKLNNSMQLLESVISVNAAQPPRVIDLLKKHIPDLKGVKVAVLGLAFKPGTDDIRESPSIPVTQMLLDEGVTVKAYDPIAKHEAQKVLGDDTVEFSEDLTQAIAGVDAIMIMTRWKDFQVLPELLSDLDPQPLVIDGRRMLDKKSIARYDGIGM